MTNNPNHGHVPEAEASQEEMHGMHERIQNYIFRGGEAHCDTRLPFVGEQLDELTGVTLPLIEGAQPTYTLPKLTGAQILQATGETARAARTLKIAEQDTVEFTYSTPCIVIDTKDGSQEANPSQVSMVIKRPHSARYKGSPIDIFTVYDESLGVYGSFYERDFDSDAEIKNFDPGSLAIQRIVEGAEHDLSLSEEEEKWGATMENIGIGTFAAAALENGSIRSEGIDAMHGIFDLVDPAGRSQSQ